MARTSLGVLCRKCGKDEWYLRANQRGRFCAACNSQRHENNREARLSYFKQYRENNPEVWRAYYEKERDARLAYAKRHHRTNPWSRLYTAAKRRARNRGQALMIAAEDVRAVWPEDSKCPACKQTLACDTPHAPSLDRVLAERGYEPGNIAIICKQCNRRKNDSTADQLMVLARWTHRAEVAAHQAMDRRNQ